MRNARALLAMLAVLVAATGCDCGGRIGDGGAGGDGGPDASADGGPSSSVSGLVTNAETGAPIPAARVTLANAALTYFDEVRTGADGRYVFADVPAGDYAAGASFLRREYLEMSVTVAAGPVGVDFALGPETSPGRWTVIGDTNPDYFPAGTPSATLTPDGRIFYCHDTLDAVIFDPRTGDKDYASLSPSSQGCHMSTALTDGRLLFVGGQNPEDPGSFVNAIPWVKAWDPVTDTWEVLPDLNEPRWYPTLLRLPDERLLVCGGGQPPAAARTDTCELFDPATETWTPTGSMLAPTEYAPSALLYTGEVLLTWYPPQIYDLVTETWRATGNFVQPDRGFPDHSPHTLVLLADGSALAVGNIETAGPDMVERFDPVSETWAVRASPDTRRSRPEVVLLPDGRVLCAGGDLEENDPTIPVNAWGRVALADLYDPETDVWRAMEPMALEREYHAMTLLVPDGRVVTTSGSGNQAMGSAPENSVEAFEPPYLFRGVRPRITSLTTTDLVRGVELDLVVDRTRAPTAVLLMGLSAVTHWMDGGVGRFTSLGFTLTGSDPLAGVQVRATISADPVQLPAGYYLLFALVDDIPSEARIVRVLP